MRDARAFDAAYEAHRAPLFRFLARMTRRREVAEELLQETWLRLARHAPALPDDTDLGGWLFTVARNLCRSHLRWQLLDATRLLDLRLGRGEALAASPFEAAATNEAGRALERALAALSVGDREVLLLVGVEGLEPIQAAAILGLRPDALRQRLARARGRLAERLAGTGLEPEPAPVGEIR